MIMLTTFFPLIFYRLPPFIGSHHFYAIIFVFSTLFLYPEVFTNKIVLLDIGYGVFLLVMLQFWTYLDPWAIRQMWNDYYGISIGLLIITYFQETRDFKGLAVIAKYTLIFIVITALLTIITSFIMNSTSRAKLFGDSPEAIETQMLFAKYGSGSYASCIVFMSIISLLVYYLKNSRLFIINSKWLILVCLILLLGGVLRLQLFTNLIFAILVLLLSIVDLNNRKVLIITLLCILTIFIIIPRSLYISALNGLSSLFSGILDGVSFKFKEFAIYFENGPDLLNETNNAVANRSARFPILYEGFIKYPIFGCSVSHISKQIYEQQTGHLYWMFKLSMMGIVNLIFYLSIFYLFIKQQRKFMNKEYFYYFLISVLSVLLYGILKVTGGREAWYFLFVVAPALYWLPLTNSKYLHYINRIRCS